MVGLIRGSWGSGPNDLQLRLYVQSGLGLIVLYYFGARVLKMGTAKSTGIAQLEVKVLYQQNTVQTPVFPSLKEPAWMEERESFINHVFMASEGLGKITVIAQQLPLDPQKKFILTLEVQGS